MKEDDEEDDLRAIRRLREEIKQEREITVSLRVSANQWRNIVRDILSVTADTNQEEAEWRLRCHYQSSFNEMLQQRINDLKREIRVLKKGGGDVNIPLKGDIRRMTLTECRIHVRHLENDLTSMKSLRGMYERQLDHESIEYAKIREKRSAIIRDIFFLQKSCMRQLENFEKEYFTKMRGKYGGDLFRPSKLQVRLTRPDLTVSRPSNNVIDVNKDISSTF